MIRENVAAVVDLVSKSANWYLVGTCTGGRRGKARDNPELSALKPGHDVTNVLRLMQGGNAGIKVLNNFAAEKQTQLYERLYGR